MATNVIATLSLTQQNSVIVRNINQAIVRAFNKAAQKSVSSLTNSLRRFIDLAIRRSDEYKELAGRGPLLGHLGVPNINMALNGILEIWKQQINITNPVFRVSGADVVGSFRVGIIERNMKKVVESAFGSYEYFSDFYQITVRIPWLEWLLLSGDRILVIDFDVNFRRVSGSRTGLATMARNDGGFWRIPPQWSGDINNNWITRTLEKVRRPFAESIVSHITTNIQ